MAIAFGYVFYLPMALTPFFVLIFFLGIGGANFAMYTLWLPEQYSTDCRASAIAFVSSVGRFVGVAMVFLVGAAIQSYGSLGVPVAVTALGLRARAGPPAVCRGNAGQGAADVEAIGN